MKTVKLLRIVAALLAGFVAGAYAVQWWPKRMHPELKRLGESVAYTDPLYRQYRDGDYAQAKAAMLELTRHLDGVDAETARPVTCYASDAMSAFVRLAKLEERHGGGERERFMREAVSRCEEITRRTGRKADCSEAHLRAEVDRTDALIR